jgi:hypothetical protein
MQATLAVAARINNDVTPLHHFRRAHPHLFCGLGIFELSFNGIDGALSMRRYEPI